MRIFNKEFAGTVLIWLGVLIFLGVIYDYIRPVFPSHSPYSFIKSIQSFILGDSTPDGEDPLKKNPPATRPYSNLPSGDFYNDDNLLTTSEYRPGDAYQQWVWAIKPEYITGDQVIIEMAHAAQGDEGGFKIISYTDSDNDGKPDKKIAESGYLTGKQRGDWSSFTFTTKEKRIFVGNEWLAGQNTIVFRGNGDWPSDDSPLEGRFFYIINGSNSRSAGPAFTNLRVTFSTKE